MDALDNLHPPISAGHIQEKVIYGIVRWNVDC